MMPPPDSDTPLIPYWMPESQTSALVWRWEGAMPAHLNPMVVLALTDGTDCHIFGEAFAEDETGMIATPAGLVFRLDAKEAKALQGRGMVMAVWIDAARPGPDVLGHLFVSDWSASPHHGTA